jgi:Ribosomal RNA adenine dimethylase
MTLSRLIFARSEMTISQVFRVSYAKAASRFGSVHFSSVIRTKKRDNENVKSRDQTKKKSSDRKARRMLQQNEASDADDKAGLDKETIVNSSQVTIIGDTLSESSRLLKKPKKRPLKVVNSTGGISKGTINNEVAPEVSTPKPLGFSRKSTKSREMAQETIDTLIRLTNKHTNVEQEAPFSMPNAQNEPSIDVSSRPKGKLTFSKKREEEDDEERDRPFTLPSGKFKPRQSLGQNFLSDQNYVMKICDSFKDDSEKGKNVIEIGPGPGALTRVLYRRYPNMTAIEIDERAVEFLAEKIPGIINICANIILIFLMLFAECCE